MKNLETMHQQKKLYEVSDNIQLEIHQNEKGIYVCCWTKERFGAFNNVWMSAIKMCSNCTNEDCVFHEKLAFVFKEFIKVDVHKWKFPNNFWKVYLNLNEHRFKIEHDIGNQFL